MIFPAPWDGDAGGSESCLPLFLVAGLFWIRKTPDTLVLPEVLPEILFGFRSTAPLIVTSGYTHHPIQGS